MWSWDKLKQICKSFSKKNVCTIYKTGDFLLIKLNKPSFCLFLIFLNTQVYFFYPIIIKQYESVLFGSLKKITANLVTFFKKKKK